MGKGYCEFKKMFSEIIQQVWEGEPIPKFAEWIRGWNVDN